jgi:hypothetical protein
VRFEMDVRRRRCLWAPSFIHCGYYQRSGRKIAFVWIVRQVSKHHVCFLKARDPRRRAARIRSLACELPAEIDGVGLVLREIKVQREWLDVLEEGRHLDPFERTMAKAEVAAIEKYLGDHLGGKHADFAR